jgi:hypothetical protein
MVPSLVVLVGVVLVGWLKRVATWLVGRPGAQAVRPGSASPLASSAKRSNDRVMAALLLKIQGDPRAE